MKKKVGQMMTTDEGEERSREDEELARLRAQVAAPAEGVPDV